MSSDFKLEWHGDELYQLYNDAVAESIDETTAEAAQLAAANAPQHRGFLAAGIHNEPARPEGDDSWAAGERIESHITPPPWKCCTPPRRGSCVVPWTQPLENWPLGSEQLRRAVR